MHTGGEDTYEISHFHNFQTSTTLTFDRPLLTHQISFKSEKKTLWVDGQTLRPALLGRLEGVDLKGTYTLSIITADG